MKHQAWIKNYENDFERLAEEVGDLRYDSLAEFLSLLAKKMKTDAGKDKDRDRHNLAEALYDTKDKLAKAADSIDHAWKICEPYMLPPDIIEKIHLDFKTPQDQRAAIKLLLNLGKREYVATNNFRIERCVLFNTNGDLNKLRLNAKFDDYRDIILQAEYEGDEQVRDLNFPFGTAKKDNEGNEFLGTSDDLPF